MAKHVKRDHAVMLAYFSWNLPSHVAGSSLQFCRVLLK